MTLHAQRIPGQDQYETLSAQIAHLAVDREGLSKMINRILEPPQPPSNQSEVVPRTSFVPAIAACPRNIQRASNVGFGIIISLEIHVG